MAKMRRFDNGGEIGLGGGGAGSGASKSGPYMSYGNPTDITPGVSNYDPLDDMGRPIAQGPSYQTMQTPANHFTNMPSGSPQQFNAMRSAIGLSPMEDSDDNDANIQKAKGMMRSIVGLTPNDNNYSLQDAISQLRGQYSAPVRPSLEAPASCWP